MLENIGIQIILLCSFVMGLLRYPKPRSVIAGGCVGSIDVREMEESGVSVCGGASFDGQMGVTYGVEAGGELKVEWDVPKGPGDCSLYVTYDSSDTLSTMKWFKLADIPGCSEREDSSVSISIPAEIMHCEHCILRWEWIDLSCWPDVRVSVDCVDFSISSEGASIPYPLFSIPGHLPRNGRLFRFPMQNSFDFIAGYPVGQILYWSSNDSSSLSCLEEGILCEQRNDDCQSLFFYCDDQLRKSGPFSLGKGVTCTGNQFITNQECGI